MAPLHVPTMAVSALLLLALPGGSGASAAASQAAAAADSGGPTGRATSSAEKRNGAPPQQRASRPVAASRGAAAARQRLLAKAEFVRTMSEAIRDDPPSDVRDDDGEEPRRRLSLGAKNLRPTARQRKEMKERALSRAVPRRRPSNTAAGVVPEFMQRRTGTEHKSQRRPSSVRRLGEDDEDDNGNNQNNNANGDDDEEVQWENFGFDPSTYSLKYAGCTAVATFSDDVADDERAEYQEDATIVAHRKFVVFRLCPTETCSDDDDLGCDDNYGEYLVPLEDYLESYAQFREEQSEAYCDYCEQCYYYEEFFFGGGGSGGGSSSSAASSNQMQDAAVYGNSEGGGQGGDRRMQQQQQQHACKYFDKCDGYQYACGYADDDNEDQQDNNNDEDNNANEGVDFAQFFECAEFDYGDVAYYVGPMCNGYSSSANSASSNSNSQAGSSGGGRTKAVDSDVKFGIFSDPYCSNYVGDQVDFFTLTGLDYATEEAALDLFSSRECVSCLEREEQYLVVKYDQEDDDVISELCENLYVASAKCNQNIQYADGVSYQTYNQMKNEQLVCSFIENVMSGTYSETDYLFTNLDALAGNYVDGKEEDDSNISPYAYYDNAVLDLWSKDEVGRTSTGQILGLAALLTACLAMVVWACFLQRLIRQQRKFHLQNALMYNPGRVRQSLAARGGGGRRDDDDDLEGVNLRRQYSYSDESGIVNGRDTKKGCGGGIGGGGCGGTGIIGVDGISAKDLGIDMSSVLGGVRRSIGGHRRGRGRGGRGVKSSPGSISRAVKRGIARSEASVAAARGGGDDDGDRTATADDEEGSTVGDSITLNRTDMTGATGATLTTAGGTTLEGGTTEAEEEEDEEAATRNSDPIMADREAREREIDENDVNEKVEDKGGVLTPRSKNFGANKLPASPNTMRELSRQDSEVMLNRTFSGGAWGY